MLSDLGKCHVNESQEHQSIAVYRKCHKIGWCSPSPAFVFPFHGFYKCLTKMCYGALSWIIVICPSTLLQSRPSSLSVNLCFNEVSFSGDDWRAKALWKNVLHIPATAAHQPTCQHAWAVALCQGGTPNVTDPERLYMAHPFRNCCSLPQFPRI